MIGFRTSEWLYAFKTFGAAMLALGIGFAANLDRPYWALATVYIASQPHAGTTRSKAAYRLAGTLLGAAATITLVPNLVDAPVLLVGALACWIALMLTLALLDRTPLGYVFMLAGYTAAIIGFPSVGAPEAIWPTALARVEEIGLGIVCATLVSSLVFPRHIAPMILERIETWLRDGRQSAEDVLGERTLSAAGRADRARLAADVIDIGVLTTQLRYDDAGHGVSVQAADALHARLLMLLPILSSITSRLSALRASGCKSDALCSVLAETTDLIAREDQADALDRLSGTIVRLQAEADKSDLWSDIMLAGLFMRLRELVTLLRDCRILQIHLRAGRPGLPALAGGVEIEAERLQHRDMFMAIFSGLSAGLAVALVCAYWIAAAWPEGAIAAMLSAVACSFFAAQDDPAPAIVQFLRWTIVAIVVDAVYLFAILPAIDGFVMLMVVLAPTFILYGLLSARPATASIGMALAANGGALLALQGTYSADFPGFVNNGIAAVFGVGAAAIVTKLIRSVGADWSAWRLVRSNWLSLADAAMRRGRGDRTAFAGLMMDRIGLVAMRLNRLTPQQAPSTSKLAADLRIGLNIVDLRRARHGLPPSVTLAIDTALDGVAAHYRSLARGPLAEPTHLPDPGLLERIDEAVASVSTLPTSSVRQDAMLGLVGIRLGLYPDAAPYTPTPDEPISGQQVAA